MLKDYSIAGINLPRSFATVDELTCFHSFMKTFDDLPCPLSALMSFDTSA